MSAKTISNVAQELIPGNTYRKSFSIQNQDGTDSVYIKKEKGQTLSVSATVHDWKLGPGGLLFLNSQQDGLEAIQDRYTIIASANTPQVAYFETEDIKR